MRSAVCLFLTLLVGSSPPLYAEILHNEATAKQPFSLLEEELKGTSGLPPAQAPGNGQGGELDTIPPGARIRITLTNGAVLEGRLAGQQPESLTIQNSDLRRGQIDLPEGVSVRDRLTLPRSSIASIEALPRQRMPRSVKIAIWVGVGVAAVLLTGHAVCQSRGCL